MRLGFLSGWGVDERIIKMNGILRTMMTELDDASDKIPEGFYLQFCDHMKRLHGVYKEEVRVTPVYRMSTTLKERWYQYCLQSGRIYTEVDETIKSLRLLRVRTRVTKSVKNDAGSDDRVVCKYFLEEWNKMVSKRRIELNITMEGLNVKIEELIPIRAMIVREEENDRAEWEMANILQ